MVQKRLNISVSFLASLFTSKILSTRKTEGGDDNRIEEQQVRNCLEKRNVFKTLDRTY